ncbi:uncharacterized protein LOC132926250 [Rhopalosiphum padi]|uniref:uncharacterized protein LOC132926250 n=1 Tax=Rhopalosiphum padi TaxID=40932 RepID=UPI00298E38CD|nr:uncharacterized protein LOC132926250 [Rhopalosiphum padi]
MIATQIFISMVVLISSVHFITCLAVTSGGATKPNMSKFAVVSDKPDTTSDMQLGEETNQSNTGLSLVPTKVRNVVSKSVGLMFWPVKKSWQMLKGFMPLRRNIHNNNMAKYVENGAVVNYIYNTFVNYLLNEIKMISTRFFMSAITLLIVVQCITCLVKTGTNVGATKPDKNSFISINKSESPPEEEVTTEDNSLIKSTTNCIRNIIPKSVDLVLWPLKGVMSSLKTATNIFNPQTTTNKKLLKNST